MLVVQSKLCYGCKRYRVVELNDVGCKHTILGAMSDVCYAATVLPTLLPSSSRVVSFKIAGTVSRSTEAWHRHAASWEGCGVRRILEDA